MQFSEGIYLSQTAFTLSSLPQRYLFEIQVSHSRVWTGADDAYQSPQQLYFGAHDTRRQSDGLLTMTSRTSRHWHRIRRCVVVSEYHVYVSEESRSHLQRTSWEVDVEALHCAKRLDP